MLKVYLLGKFEVELDGKLIEIPWRPAQLLLAYLILNADTSFRRDKLSGLLWPDSDEANARSNLRQALWRLRKAVGEGYFLADRVSVGFNPNADYQLDVAVLQDKVAETDTSDEMMRSVSVYQDILLPGFYEDWVLLEQERLQAIFEDRMQVLLDRLTEEARWREVREWAERWIAKGQVPEPAYRALMLAHAGLGDRAGLGAAFQRCVKALDEEIGVEPSAETRVLYERLCADERLPGAQIDDAKPRPAATLPVHPTRFFGRKDELAQLAPLLADRATRLVTILGPGGIGKTRLAIEAAKMQSEAFSDGVYFVSLASLDDPAFIASQIADALNFSFHVRDQREEWVADPQLEQVLAYLRNKQMLLVLDNAEHLLSSALPPLEEWKKGIDELVADIVRAAPEVKILATTRERFKIQGETLFALDGLSYPEGRFSFAKMQTVTAHSAVQLFAYCASQVQTGFALTPDNLGDVIDICHLVGGMPLGIELAAAWVELLSPAEIAAEIRSNLDFLETTLRDVPDRQRSIRSVFETLWQRLTETEQDVFRQLSVFRSSFTRRAAQQVTANRDGSPASLRTLMALVHKSVVRPDFNGRYQIHELLRQFGSERLSELPAEEASAKDRHCAYYAAFLKGKEADLIGQNQGRAFAEIEAELGNVQAAWDWAVAQGKLVEIDLAMESLCEFHRVRGGLDDGAETFAPAARALEWEGFRAPEDLPDRHEMFNETMHLLETDASIPESADKKLVTLGKVLARCARFYCESPGRAWAVCQLRQDSLAILSRTGARREMAYVLRYLAHVWNTPADAATLYRQALAIFDDLNDDRGRAETAYRLGAVATRVGDYKEAERIYQDSLNLSKRLGRRETIGNCLLELSYVLWALGDYQAAAKRCREGLSIVKEIGYQSQIAWALRQLARVAVGLENLSTAKRHLQDSLTIYREVGLRGLTAETLGELGQVAVMEKDSAKARRLAQESLTICQEQEHRAGMVKPLTVLGEIALELGDLTEAETCFQKALRTATQSRTPPDALHVLVGMAKLLATVGEKERAWELATIVRHHPASWQWSKDRVAPLVAELETGLAPETVAPARVAGNDQTLEEVIKELTRKDISLPLDP